MLRITILQQPEATSLRLEGKLIGPWVEELARAWNCVRRDTGSPHVNVDLSGVTFVTDEGKRVLAQMAKEGAEFHAPDIVNQAIISDLLRRQPGNHLSETKYHRNRSSL